jgi:hypothetical protein
MSGATVVRPARRFSRMTAALLLLTASLGLLAIASGSVLAEAQPAPLWFGAAVSPISGASLYVSGGINVADDLAGQTVTISKREMGENSDTVVAAAVPVTHAPWGNVFSATLPGLRHSAILTATWAGDADYLSSSRWTFVPVRAKVTIALTRQTAKFLRLRATVSPLQPQDAPAFISAKSPFVLFQRKMKGAWRYMGMGDTMSSDGQSWQSSTYYGLKPGTYVLRARFVGGDYNAAAVSKTLRVMVR